MAMLMFEMFFRFLKMHNILFDRTLLDIHINHIYVHVKTFYIES